MSLDTQNINASLVGGLTSDGLTKNGSHATFLALFDAVESTAVAVLEQSPDGANWSELEESEVTIEPGQTEQMWVENNTPRGTLLRLKITETTGTLVAIKLLSNE